MKFYFLTFIAVTFLLCCKSKAKTSNETTIFELQKVILHSSPCFGWCPRIDLEIDNGRNINLSRQFYIYASKGKEDSHLSGNYKGILDKASYDTLKQLLLSCNIDSLKFPVTGGVDGRFITIIVYHNNKRIYLKSIEPPFSAHSLISFLSKIGTEYPVSESTEVPKIEE